MRRLAPAFREPSLFSHFFITGPFLLAATFYASWRMERVFPPLFLPHLSYAPPFPDTMVSVEDFSPPPLTYDSSVQQLPNPQPSWTLQLHRPLSYFSSPLNTSSSFLIAKHTFPPPQVILACMAVIFDRAFNDNRYLHAAFPPKVIFFFPSSPFSPSP